LKKENNFPPVVTKLVLPAREAEGRGGCRSSDPVA